VELLADRKPLHGGDSSALRDVDDTYTRRTAELDPKLPVHAA